MVKREILMELPLKVMEMVMDIVMDTIGVAVVMIT